MSTPCLTPPPPARSPAHRGALAFCAVLVAASPARADAVLDWNATALRTTAAAAFNPPLESRNLAIVQAAVFDAVTSITRDFQPYRVRLAAPPGAAAEAAAVAAAHVTLLRLYPEQQAALDAARAASLAGLPGGPSQTEGVAVGEAVANRLLALREADGAAGAITTHWSPPARVGAWEPTPPALLPALDPGWGSVTPFVLRSGSQFRPGPPPELASARYAEDLLEVQALGAAASPTRTGGQTELARLWVATAPQVWNPVARDVAAARGLRLSQTARVLALLNLAGADAFIAAWDAKFRYGQWRPVTAIRAADRDGNPRTAGDAAWTPLLVTPPFPDYIAGHTTWAGAASRVLGALLGESPGVPLVVSSRTAPGVVRTYASFAEVAADVVEARVLGGIHWRTSSVVGRQVGESIGRFAVRHALLPTGDECADDD